MASARLPARCSRPGRLYHHPVHSGRRLAAADVPRISGISVSRCHPQRNQRVRQLHASSSAAHHGHLSQPASPSPSPAWNERASVAAATASAPACTSHQPPGRPMRKLSLPALLRGIVIQEVMSRPATMDLACGLLRKNMQAFLGHPLCRLLLDRVFYTQFCAGRTADEIGRTLDGLRALGYRGPILMYAREADLSTAPAAGDESGARHRAHVAQWRRGNLQTIEYVAEGDCVAVKYSGAGIGCVRALEARAGPDEIMADALEQICQAAKRKGVKLLVDAEHHSLQHGIDAWTMALMEKHNRDGQLVVYNTYQMYLKESPATLAAHVELARRRNFALGVKLVRGAYLHSDPRHLIHDRKADTDRAFDDAARMLATLHVTDPTAPRVGLVLASHNRESTERMRELRREQVRLGQPLADVVYAQLMGMADELSLSLTQRTDPHEETPQVFKYVVWGTTEECVRYLLRRAEENRDAVERSALTRRALWDELRRRLRV